MKWIDVHTHINMLEKDSELSIQSALDSGVERMLTIGTGHDDLPHVMSLVEKYKPHVFGTLGFHPHEAKTYNQEGESFLRANLSHPRIVAVGEIGLDYYYEHSPKDTQIEVFRKQMEVAQEFGLPVEIHSRDAEEDTIRVLSEFKGRVRGLLHCFTGTQWLADEGLKLGYNISFSGVVTFKSAEALREVAQSVPLDRMHIETDAPFLTPVPFRGKKNEPSMMVHTAQKLAELKGISLEELSAQTNKNALDLFKKLSWQ